MVGKFPECAAREERRQFEGKAVGTENEVDAGRFDLGNTFWIRWPAICFWRKNSAPALLSMLRVGISDPAKMTPNRFYGLLND